MLHHSLLMVSHNIRWAVKKFPELPCRQRMRDKIAHGLLWWDRVLLVTSMCKFCRGCAMQFRRSGTTSGRDSNFCITTTHRGTHRLLCSNSSPRKISLLSSNHCTLQITLRVTFGCSLLWKWASRGRILQPWRTSNRMRWTNSGRFQKKPSAGTSNNGGINGASVCAHKGPTLKMIT